MGHLLGSSRVGFMATSYKWAYATQKTAAPRVSAPAAGHCWPMSLQETLKHSKAGMSQSLWEILVHTRFCLSPLSISGRYGAWFQKWLSPSYHLAMASPLPLDLWYIFLVVSNILLSMVVPQQHVILEFSQEKMSTHFLLWDPLESCASGDTYVYV